jgi:AraC family transcriptional regulator
VQNAEACALSVTPDQWAARLSGPADFSSDRLRWPSALLRHWTGTSPDMQQPPLDHHYIVQHLGGAKKVDRRRDGAPVSTVVENGSLTIVPVGTEFGWHTQGPIEFAHLYISPALLNGTAVRFERVDQIALIDRVGCQDPLLGSLYGSMIAELKRPEPEILFLDSLLETFMLKLLLAHSSAKVRYPKHREMLDALQLRRVTDYVEAHLGEQLTLAELARVAGGSVFHFIRAFKNTMGHTPYGYVLHRRTERAKHLLSSSDHGIAAIAAACGFMNTARFAKTFKRLTRITPSRYRRL